ncbi:MAG: glycosyltransferase [Betaproteobacteria bacterium]|nr:glycosyltransferase [Betaproteobacteria bacterium]
MDRATPITIAIPTYRREQVLLETLDYLLALNPAAAEILVIDQTERHDSATLLRLNELSASGSIRLVTLPTPSITHAMNIGLIEASQDIVVFVDDDIRPDPELLAGHLAAHLLHSDILVAGRVIQPWQEGTDFAHLEQGSFAALKANWIDEFMGGNFSVRRGTALALGGFDENFVRVAYRFEAEFAHRLRASGRRIYFEPRARPASFESRPRRYAHVWRASDDDKARPCRRRLLLLPAHMGGLE